MNRCRIEGKVLAVFLQKLLALLAQHKADEFANLRIDRLSRRRVEPEGLTSPKRIAVVLQRVHRVLHERARGGGSQLQDPDVLREIGMIPHVRDSVWIVADMID